MSVPFSRFTVVVAGLVTAGGCAVSGANSGKEPSPAGDDSGSLTDTSPSTMPLGDAPGDAGSSDAQSGGHVEDGSREAAGGGQSDAAFSDANTDSEVAAAFDGGIGGSNAAVPDDFESGSLSKWTVTDPFGGALQSTQSVAIDTTNKHGGRYSVKVHNGGVIGTAPPSAAFYGRFWVWLGSNPSPSRGSGGHWAWTMAPGTLSDGAMPEIRQGGQFDILTDNDSLGDDVVLSDPNVFTDADGGISPPVAQWLCVEFFYGKDSLRTWIQGSEVSALNVTPSTVWAHGMTAPWSPTYSAIRIGYAGYNGNQIDLWIDDVALDAARIGCN